MFGASFFWSHDRVSFVSVVIDDSVFGLVHSPCDWGSYRPRDDNCFKCVSSAKRLRISGEHLDSVKRRKMSSNSNWNGGEKVRNSARQKRPRSASSDLIVTAGIHLRHFHLKVLPFERALFSTQSPAATTRLETKFHLALGTRGRRGCR